MEIIALKQKIESGSLKVGDKIFYEPKYRECVLSSAETGVGREQKLATEEIKYCYVGMINDKVLIAAIHPTQHKVSLKACYDDVKLLEKLCDNLYSYPELGAKAMPITQEIFEQFPESWSGWSYWIGTGSKEHDELYYSASRKVYSKSSAGQKDCEFLIGGLLPVVLLPAETLIDEENWIISDSDYEGKVPKDPNSEIIKNMVRKNALQRLSVLKEDMEYQIEQIYKQAKDVKTSLEQVEEIIKCIEKL